jgi:hypothetical protein
MRPPDDNDDDGVAPLLPTPPLPSDCEENRFNGVGDRSQANGEEGSSVAEIVSETCDLKNGSENLLPNGEVCKSVEDIAVEKIADGEDSSSVRKKNRSNGVSDTMEPDLFSHRARILLDTNVESNFCHENR